MHIWNIKYLTDEMNTGQLSEQRAFGYFFLVITLNCLSVFIPSLIGVDTPLATVPFGPVILALNLAVVMVGLVMSFRAFQRRHNHDFIQKFMCLLLPAGIRAFIFCLPLFVVAALVVRQFSSDDRRIVIAQTGALITTAMFVVQFIIIYRSILLISEPLEQQGNAAA